MHPDTNQYHGIKIPKENPIEDQVNIIRLLNRINECERKISQMQQQMDSITVIARTPKAKKEKSIKEKKQYGSYAPHVLSILKDGKVWSVYAILEELQKQNPDFPAPKFTSLGFSLGEMARRGQIAKVANGNYRALTKA